MQGPRYAIALASISLAGMSLSYAFGPMRAAKMKPSYATVAPTIAKNCVGCHSGAHPKHELDLSSYAKVMKGDKEGKVVIAGKPGSSRLSMSVHHKGAASMPPGRSLSAAEIAKIDAWIKAGASK